jgi:hypothetical protein
LIYTSILFPTNGGCIEIVTLTEPSPLFTVVPAYPDTNEPFIIARLPAKNTISVLTSTPLTDPTVKETLTVGEAPTLLGAGVADTKYGTPDRDTAATRRAG